MRYVGSTVYQSSPRSITVAPPPSQPAMVAVVNPMSDAMQGISAHISSLQMQIQELVRTLNNERQARERLEWSSNAERQAREGVEAKLAGLETEVSAVKAHFNTREVPVVANGPTDRGFSILGAFGADKNAQAIRSIEARGNVEIDHATGHVHLLQHLKFRPRTTRDPPTAEFVNPAVADAICADLAQLSSMFHCPMRIEGHTKGGEGEFWQALAEDRARIVAEKIIEHGGDGAKFTTIGRPGRTGLNETKTMVYFDVPVQMDAQHSHERRGWSHSVAHSTELVQTSPAVYSSRSHHHFPESRSEGTLRTSHHSTQPILPARTSVTPSSMSPRSRYH